jgi:hypothetical protein
VAIRLLRAECLLDSHFSHVRGEWFAGYAFQASRRTRAMLGGRQRAMVGAHMF